MAIILDNGNVRIKIETAGENYKGSRFDWNGTVISAKFNEIETLGEEKIGLFLKTRAVEKPVENVENLWLSTRKRK